MAYLTFTWYWHDGIEGEGWRVLETPNPTPWDWLDYIPPPVGTEIYLSPGWVNDEAAPVTGQMIVQVDPPSGTSYAFFPPGTSVDPGEGIHQQLTPFTLDEAGTWVMQVWLNVGGIYKDYKSVNFDVEGPIDTSITINGPPTFDTGDPFMVHGILRDAGGTPLGGLNVKLFVDEVFLTQENTQSDGSYAFTIALSEPRNYIITASYGGTSASLTLNLKI
jgi:hypothetical protein